jgi:uncharacterized membrane protein required for colicin V production
MIAAAIKTAEISTTTFGWFDAVVIVALAFGLFRGRRNGIAKELVPTLMWIALVVVSGLCYPLGAQAFINYLSWGKLSSSILSYVIIAVVVYVIFSIVNRAVTAKLVASNVFGSGEYYLGMPAGMIRFACILLAALALLNAPVYSAADVAAQKAYVAQTYGGGQSGFSGDFFPSLQSIQEQVFKQSFTGPYIKTCFAPVLINVGGPDAKGQKGVVPQQKHPVIHMGN